MKILGVFMNVTVSFDFDDTLAEEVNVDGRSELMPKHTFIDLVKCYHALNCNCIILTARPPTKYDLDEMRSFLKTHSIEKCISEIVCTNHELKGPFAAERNVKLHYDDSEKHIASVQEFGIKTVFTLI